MTITSSNLDSGAFRASLTVSPDHPRAALTDDLRTAIAALRPPSRTEPVQVWLEEASDTDDAVIAEVARPYRDLLQLRLPLPAEPSGLTTRDFEPENDADEWIAVNNRAFAWHPEQAGMTPQRLTEAMAEPWFRTEGFRILELDHRIAGFCWTKIHTDTEPIIGEIYVIAVDPDFHGRGLGGPMTLAGLEWLASQDITMSNLYVEADNEPAVRTYARLGFTTYAVNRAYSTASA
jgi:mycothiol synthase